MIFTPIKLVGAFMKFEGICASTKKARRSKNEEELAKKFNKLFEKTIKKVIEEYERRDTPTSGDQITNSINILSQELSPVLTSAIEEVITRPNVSKQQIRDNVSRSTKLATDRMRDKVTDILEDSIKQGLGVKEVVNLLKGDLEGFAEHEVERLVRTELIGASNTNNYQSLVDMGVDYHQWITAEDDKVRDSHIELHGEITRVGKLFSNGLLYPGDRSGPIEEWIQCRCVAVPYFLPSDTMPPIGTDYFFEDDLIKLEGKGEEE